MRRVTAVLAGIAAAGAMALALPGTAWAAHGTLVVNGLAHNDPSGCYPSDRVPLTVENLTDAYAVVFDDANCSGNRVGIFAPGSYMVSGLGRSVYVD